MGRVEGKVAVITGGASGIGEATVRRFCEEGARVVIADIQEDRGKALAEELGDVARFARVDVTEEDQVAAAVADAVDNFGRLDVMFNNAGIVGALGSLLETPADRWRKTIDILLNGVFIGLEIEFNNTENPREINIWMVAETAFIILFSVEWSFRFYFNLV